jgi:hypothetical protein
VYYKEYLRARGLVLIYAIVAAGLFVISSVLTWLFGMGDIDSSLHKATNTLAALQPMPWPALFGVAAFFAAIASTVLGSTLSQENDGHLELALTKPRSRNAYASTMIAVDLAAIAACTVIGFVFIVLHILTFHHRTTAYAQGYYLVNGPDVLFNVLRFMAFPLAWYAIVAALSAGMRGKAGVVQGLIWPVALGLEGARHFALPVMGRAWFEFFVFLNLINPLVYSSYQDIATDSTVQLIGPGAASVVVSFIALGVLLAIGWTGALYQWRRVEA